MNEGLKRAKRKDKKLQSSGGRVGRWSQPSLFVAGEGVLTKAQLFELFNTTTYNLRVAERYVMTAYDLENDWERRSALLDIAAQISRLLVGEPEGGDPHPTGAPDGAGPHEEAFYGL